MTKFDFPVRDAAQPRAAALPSPFVAQGVRDALRNAYCGAGDAVPAEFAALLEKLR